jgi:hypothetical protein
VNLEEEEKRLVAGREAGTATAALVPPEPLCINSYPFNELVRLLIAYHAFLALRLPLLAQNA